MKVGFTGTQVGMTEQQLKRFEKVMRGFTKVHEFHHGDCIGADAQAAFIVDQIGIDTVIHPPTVDAKRAFCNRFIRMEIARPYLDRNRAIVRKTDIIVATPKSREEEARSGTWFTVRQARKLGKKVYIIMPEGDVVIGGA